MARKAFMIPAVLGVLVPAAIALVMVFRGTICAGTWSGEDTLRCNSGMIIKNKNVTLDKHIVYAESKCRATLINVDFDSPNPIYLQSGAIVVLKNSRIKGRKQGIYVGSRAELRLENTTVEVEQSAIHVGTGARVLIRGGKVTAGNKAVFMGSKAEVKVRKARIEGTLYVGTASHFEMKGGTVASSKRAVYAGSRSKAHFHGTRIAGPIYTGTHAKVRGAVIHRLTKPWTCRGDTEAILEGVTLKTGRYTPVTVTGGCRLELRNPHLQARYAALRVRNKGQVTVTGGTLVGGQYAVRASDDAVVTLAKVEVRGKIDGRGGATVSRDGEKQDGGGVALPDAR